MKCLRCGTKMQRTDGPVYCSEAEGLAESYHCPGCETMVVQPLSDQSFVRFPKYLTSYYVYDAKTASRVPDAVIMLNTDASVTVHIPGVAWLEPHRYFVFEDRRRYKGA